MTRAVVVADSGTTLASLTEAVLTLKGAHVVGHGNARTRLDRILRALRPDIVVIGDVRAPERALALLAEVHGAAPRAAIVILSLHPEASWLADALRARAAAVLPGNLDPETLGIVLREVLAQHDSAAPASSGANADRRPCDGVTAPPRRRRRARPVDVPPREGAVA